MSQARSTHQWTSRPARSLTTASGEREGSTECPVWLDAFTYDPSIMLVEMSHLMSPAFSSLPYWMSGIDVTWWAVGRREAGKEVQ